MTIRVFTSGVFDLLHTGHIRALKAARTHGDLLIVGVCSDDDAQAYKRQPVIPLNERIEMLESLACVDQVFCSPLVPDIAFYFSHRISVHIQAEDEYNHSGWRFYDAAKSLGIMRFIGRQPDTSTSSIIQRITSVKKQEVYFAR